ncbi:uncharacterized protein EV420DRAFT_1578675 [Desarmillaria tabescens]|uniref:NAD(P)-binding protein n=1 Tax=Armillaria tabescens TaxID=1929756 RepID=A0AA39JGZ9_ARMTA|nr:uncharacterized protein EV420DRAFT_1578675 [Desarmillaria tabescens]KAK0442259.1 hypothetical protein EV420DRAFT_1578675 [Desarmillaria tabescens]
MADLNVSTVLSLTGHIALITGGGMGMYGLEASALRKTLLQMEPKRTTVPIQMDVTDEESVKAGAKHIEGIDGKLDILINNAGFASSLRDPDFMAKFATADPFEPETLQNWADIFALNTIAPFFVVRAFQPLLIKGAHSRP